jgi:hypothetical protein
MGYFSKFEGLVPRWLGVAFVSFTMIAIVSYYSGRKRIYYLVPETAVSDSVTVVHRRVFVVTDTVFVADTVVRR